MSSLCNPMNYSPPGSSVHGIFPGKNTGVGCHILFQGNLPTQDSNHVSGVSCIGRWILYHCATWEGPRFIYIEHLKQYLVNIQTTKIMASGPITSWETDGETVSDFIFLCSKITADGDCSHEIKMFAPWKKSYDQPRQRIKKQRYYFANKVPSSQSCGFSSS